MRGIEKTITCENRRERKNKFNYGKVYIGRNSYY